MNAPKRLAPVQLEVAINNFLHHQCVPVENGGHVCVTCKGEILWYKATFSVHDAFVLDEHRCAGNKTVVIHKLPYCPRCETPGTRGCLHVRETFTCCPATPYDN
jgi:hypothetical protein